jgi:hypothetical protein
VLHRSGFQWLHTCYQAASTWRHYRAAVSFKLWQNCWNLEAQSSVSVSAEHHFLSPTAPCHGVLLLLLLPLLLLLSALLLWLFTELAEQPAASHYVLHLTAASCKRCYHTASCPAAGYAVYPRTESSTPFAAASEVQSPLTCLEALLNSCSGVVGLALHHALVHLEPASSTRVACTQTRTSCGIQERTCLVQPWVLHLACTWCDHQ